MSKFKRLVTDLFVFAFKEKQSIFKFGPKHV